MESPLLRLHLPRTLLLLFLWAAADLASGVTITSTDQTMVTKAQGEKVTLLCTFTLGTADEGILDIEWDVVQPNEEQPVIIYNRDRVYDQYHMAGRVQFVSQNPASGDATIDILNLKPADTGFYQCKVKKLPGVQTHRVQLIVLDETTVDRLYPLGFGCWDYLWVPQSVDAHVSINTVAKYNDVPNIKWQNQEKPTKTRCYIEGSQEIGTDVILKCKSQEGTPVINYYWTRTSGTELPATSSQNPDTGVLMMKNASHIHSGTYKCVASNRVGTDECSITLNVTPPMNRGGTIAGAVIGSLLAILLVAFIVFCCFKKQREKKYEKEVHHDIREDVPPPKSRASTARSYIGSNRSSLGSMSPSNMDGYAKTQYNKVPSEDFGRTLPQNPNYEPPKVAAPNLSRMGAIPVMIPAQSKDGSIV